MITLYHGSYLAVPSPVLHTQSGNNRQAFDIQKFGDCVPINGYKYERQCTMA